jgi:hypothetical protein
LVKVAHFWADKSKHIHVTERLFLLDAVLKDVLDFEQPFGQVDDEILFKNETEKLMIVFFLNVSFHLVYSLDKFGQFEKETFNKRNDVSVRIFFHEFS